MLPVQPGHVPQPKPAEPGKSAQSKENKSVEAQRSKISKSVGSEDFQRKIAISKTITTREEAKLHKKDAHLWQCVGRESNKPGGHLYRFRLRDAYDYFTPKKTLEELDSKIDDPSTSDAERIHLKQRAETIEEEIFDKRSAAIKKVGALFPAIEVVPDQLRETFSNPIFGSLGYTLSEGPDGVFMTLPDKKALEGNWEKLRHSSHPDLPRLDIASSKGIADDMSFVEIHLQHHGLLSSEVEFVHDHLVHILPTIEHLSTSPVDPSRNRGRLVELMAKAYRTVTVAKIKLNDLEFVRPDLRDEIKVMRERIKIIEGGLGAYVDIATNVPGLIIDKGEASIAQHFRNIWSEPGWDRYWEKRFGAEKMRDTDIQWMWGELMQLEELYDMEHRAKEEPKALGAMDRASFNEKNRAISVKTADGAAEIFINTLSQEKEGRGKYQAVSESASLALKYYDDRLEIEEVTHLDLHRHLFDLVCQYAAAHNCNTIQKVDPSTDWPIFYELGFRLPGAVDEDRDGMLIWCAKTLNLLTEEETKLLSQLGLIEEGDINIDPKLEDDPFFMDNVIFVPVYAESWKKNDLQNNNPPRRIGEIVPPANTAADKVQRSLYIPYMELDHRVFKAWKKEAEAGGLDNSSLIVSLGRQRIERDLMKLRKRMKVLNARGFGNRFKI